ncbi:MAG: hypothetical protein QXP31_05440 [Pyrobaculum sp.]
MCIEKQFLRGASTFEDVVKWYALRRESLLKYLLRLLLQCL